MYIFGEFKKQNSFSPEDARSLIGLAKEQECRLRNVPIEKIIEILDKLGKVWLENGSWFEKALVGVSQEINFSTEMIRETLRLIPSLLDRENLEQRILAEMGSLRVQNDFSEQPNFRGKVRAFPLGTVLHVAAGNIFLGCIDSLLMSFLTKNVSILKLSHRNQVFPQLFAESLLEVDTDRILANSFAIVHWKGGERSVEDIFKQNLPAILAWGGEEMVMNYREGLGLDCRLLDYGPKISFQVICKTAYNEFCHLDSSEQSDVDNPHLMKLAQKLAHEICLWDQQACASPQNLFFEKGIQIKPLMEAIAKAINVYPIPRSHLDADEQTELLKEKFRGVYSQGVEGGEFILSGDAMVHFDPQPGLRPSPLNRTLICKEFSDLNDLCAQVAPYHYYLQSCSYLVLDECKTDFLNKLSNVGVKRFAPVGTLLNGMEGGPHDGRYGLRDLVNFIPDETEGSLLGELNRVLPLVPYYRKKLNLRPVKELQELPLMNAEIFSEYPIHKSRDLINSEAHAGFIFSSGGTSGNPKYAFYSYDEFLKVAEMLAIGLKAQGLKPGDMVANLFVAGNMWSSFMAIEKALKSCEVMQLPIGGTLDVKTIINYFVQFKPRVALGLPSLMVSYANYCKKENIKICVPQVFYAGEHLNEGMRKVLREVWGTEKFCSAGYASVDAGTIGYQCEHCKPGEHHLFGDYVYLEVINEEAVVSSKFRTSMPVLRYQTGDHVEWTDRQGKCVCGRRDPKFMLYGRIDGLINIWSCRLTLGDIEKSLNDLELTAPIYQVELVTDIVDGVPQDRLCVIIEGITLSDQKKRDLKKAIYDNSKDLNSTYSYNKCESWIAIETVIEGTIPRVMRTGKIKPLLDKR